MRETRQSFAAKQHILTEVNKQLGENNAALTQAIDDLMAKYFKEADMKAESRINRLEKCIDSMHSTLSLIFTLSLSKHTEEIRIIRSDTTQLKERVSEAEQTVSQCVETMHKYQAKLTEIEDRARRDNLLIFNLKEGVEGTNGSDLVRLLRGNFV